MTNYANLNGNSSVVLYEIGQSHIDVKFNSGMTYRYTYQNPGQAEVEQMKALAVQGRGLGSYIATEIGKRYDSKW